MMTVWFQHKWRYQFYYQKTRYYGYGYANKEDAQEAEDYHRQVVKGKVYDPELTPKFVASRKAKPIEIVVDGKGCFVCISHKGGEGYPQIKRGPTHIKLSRLVYESVFGIELKPSDKIIHVCDNPACINPLHLRKATDAVNMADMIAKGRNPQIPNPYSSPRSFLYRELQGE